MSDLIKQLREWFDYRFSVNEEPDGSIRVGTSLHARHRVGGFLFQSAAFPDVLVKAIKQRLAFDMYNAACDLLVEADMSDPREVTKQLHEEVRQLKMQSRASSRG